MKSFILLILPVCCLFIGCRTTNTVTLNVQEPPPVTLPETFNRVGIIDRNISDSEKGVIEKIDQIFSVNGAELKKEGAHAGINGLFDELSGNDRFEVVKQIEYEQKDKPAYGVFPAPLSWDEIEDICLDHHLDGLYLLEFYDIDTAIDYDTDMVTAKALGLSVPVLEHEATVRTVIKTGWRIYDNTSKTIIDEYVITEPIITSGRGINPAEAIKALTGRTEAIQTMSMHIGRDYGRSILPYWIPVKRNYYVRGNDNFKMAKRRAQTGNWDGAAELWLNETENSSSKVAGRAHYNMAIINEINGDIDEAIEWARIAYEDYDDKRALRYLRILKRREESIDMLNQRENELDYE
ncbi:MAG: DUF6340 family protein [Balneolales bacterium]